MFAPSAAGLTTAVPVFRTGAGNVFKAGDKTIAISGTQSAPTATINGALGDIVTEGTGTGPVLVRSTSGNHLFSLDREQVSQVLSGLDVANESSASA
jgi:hypothetical protein